MRSRSTLAEGVPSRHDGQLRSGGLLILNADDWGRDQTTTTRILDCIRQLTSVSAMVYTDDSERAARLALELGVEVGLHLNFTMPFSESAAPKELINHHMKVAKYLQSHRLASVAFHPGLVRSFDFVVRAQLDEFRRLYGAKPARIDGHHHMHLSLNVLLQGLLPAGVVVRRNFSFEAGEKSIFNRGYRRTVDLLLARRHRIVDRFFAIPPVHDLPQLRRILDLATQFIVEVEVHPIEQKENDSLQRLVGHPLMAPIASPSSLRNWIRGAPETPH